jgi:LacI family transcriptional regulator
VARRLRIALLIESSTAIGRAIQHGIAAYARVHGPWSFYQQMRAIHEAMPDWLEQRGCEGIIARIESPKLIEQIRAVRLPTVDVLGIHELDGIPSVRSDHKAVANAAADELLSRGFGSFAFCGYAGLQHSDQRCRHFVERLQAEGFSVGVYKPARVRRTVNISATLNRGLLDEDEVAAWLGALPKPVGLMAPSDVRAQQVLNACAQHGIAVPDEVAVIGADNDELLCELSDPPLSSVDLNGEAIGFEAAALLDQMIKEPGSSTHNVRIKPRGVVVRQSTDVLAISDSAVARAEHFIRLHACNGIGVDDVYQHARLSRRTLERRFTKILGRPPGDEITRLRLGRIKELLRTTDLTLPKIADLTGFQYVETLHYFFKKNTGQTPGQYRRGESRSA